MTSPAPQLTSVAVFCGSSSGVRPAYAETVRGVGRWMAERGIQIVYGGGHVGLMGAVADAALVAGGRVVGVIPQALQDRELAHQGLTGLYVVASMHERKAVMADLAQGFVALPGGAGTLEEIFEQWTWAQLGSHAKPCGYLNVDGYWDPLTALITRMNDQGFMSAAHAALMIPSDNIADLITRFAAYAPPPATEHSPAHR